MEKKDCDTGMCTGKGVTESFNSYLSYKCVLHFHLLSHGYTPYGKGNCFPVLKRASNLTISSLEIQKLLFQWHYKIKSAEFSLIQAICIIDLRMILDRSITVSYIN